MKTILVPIDFSKESENAIVYAAEMNKSTKANILLFHTYHVPMPASDLPVLIEAEELRRDAESLLESLVKKYSSIYPEMKFFFEVEEGIPEFSIPEQEKEIDCDLMVMATKGKATLESFLIGTNVSKILRKSSRPVIAIPPAAVFHGLRKIVFAANYGESDFENVSRLIDLAKAFDSEVILLHISDGSLDKTFEFAQIEGFKKQVAESEGYDKVSFKLMEDKDVLEGLTKYIEEINADMLAVSMRNRNFIQRIFDNSLSTKIVRHLKIPLVVFHTEI